MDNNQKAVLTTLIYSDVFSFPLTEEEVWYYLGPVKLLPRKEVKKVLNSLYPFVEEMNGYFYLSGRERIVSRRQKGEKEATRKRKIGVKFARLLGYIPTIQFIGLSGKVASGSASASDDIDFFIITKKKTLFATRILVLLVLEVLGKRRRRNESQEKDKICVNFFVEETALSFPQERHDLYTAREIAQLIPLFERNRMYGTFLTRNNWMRSFLPHTIRRKSYITEHTYSIKGRILLKILTVPGVEMLLQRLQLSLIASHQTTETVTKQFLAFHPRDYRQKTMQKFSRAVTFYEPIFSEKQAETKLDYIDKGKNIFYTA